MEYIIEPYDSLDEASQLKIKSKIGKCNLFGLEYSIIDNIMMIVLSDDCIELYIPSNRKRIPKAIIETLSDNIVITGGENLEELSFRDNADITSITLDIKTDKIKTASKMFSGCFSLKTVKFINFNTSNIQDMSCMFRDCESLIDINFNTFNTKNVENMSMMFQNCISLKKLDLSSFDTSKVKTFNSMFFRCIKLKELLINRFNTYRCEDFAYMFSHMESIEILDVHNFNLRNALKVKAMFLECKKLKRVNTLNWELPGVRSISLMFAFCSSLENIDIETWKVESLVNVSYAFQACRNIRKIDMSRWKIELSDIRSAFSGCIMLKEVKLCDIYITNYLLCVDSFLFCTNLERLEVSNFILKQSIKELYKEKSTKNLDTRVFFECYDLKNIFINNYSMNTETTLLELARDSKISIPNIISKMES